MNPGTPQPDSTSAAAARAELARLAAEARAVASAAEGSAEDFARSAEAALERFPVESFAPGGTLGRPVAVRPASELRMIEPPVGAVPLSVPPPAEPAEKIVPMPLAAAPRRWQPWSLAAAAVVLLAGAFLLRPLLFRGDDQLRDGPLRVTRDGRIADPAGLPSDLLASVESSIRNRSAAVLLGDSGPLRSGPGLADLPGTALDVLLSGANALAGATLKLLQPLSGSTVEETRPELRWSPEPKAASYVVKLQQPSESEAILASATLPAGQTSWRPPRALERGEAYRWSVTALGADGQPVAASPAAALRVLSAADLTGLEQIRRAYGGSHLVLAAAYARLGMETEARREIAELARKEPDSALARELAGSLQTK